MSGMRGSKSCPGTAAGTTQSEPSTLVTGTGSNASSPVQWDECLAVLQPSLQPKAVKHFLSSPADRGACWGKGRGGQPLWVNTAGALVVSREN